MDQRLSDYITLAMGDYKDIKPEEIMAILEKHGTKVTLEQAKIILEFLIKLADLALDTYFPEDSDDP